MKHTQTDRKKVNFVDSTNVHFQKTNPISHREKLLISAIIFIFSDILTKKCFPLLFQLDVRQDNRIKSDNVAGIIQPAPQSSGADVPLNQVNVTSLI